LAVPLVGRTGLDGVGDALGGLDAAGHDLCLDVAAQVENERKV
jgi:hypothetical protein